MPAKRAVSLAMVGLALPTMIAACTYPSVDSFEGMPEPGLPNRRASDDAGTDASATPRNSSGSSGNPNNTPATTSTTTIDAGSTEPKKDAAPPPPPPPLGKWLQVNGEECGTFCATRNLTNVASAEGARCTSGENIPQSALAAGITYGDCFPNCSAHLSGSNPRSENRECYADGQKRDGDNSDVTRGCFCR